MKAPETSLQINKNIYFTNITQKTAISMATNMKKKKHILQHGGWYKELKVKEFCVFDFIIATYF